MPQKKHKSEEIVAKPRQVDVLVSQGQSGRLPASHPVPLRRPRQP